MCVGRDKDHAYKTNTASGVYILRARVRSNEIIHIRVLSTRLQNVLILTNLIFCYISGVKTKRPLNPGKNTTMSG